MSKIMPTKVSEFKAMSPSGSSVKSNGLDYNAIEAQIKFLQGKVLTVIDASMADSRQNKAIKDLINSKFSEQLNWMYELCHGHPSMGTAGTSR